ncbi:kinase-like domain-containing protein [Lactarius sanguifluus]|nr:kinase-like domain-containing protein [Lactarius sanguifluus]
MPNASSARPAAGTLNHGRRPTGGVTGDAETALDNMLQYITIIGADIGVKYSFVRVSGQYRIGKLLGSGGSGSIYVGKDIKTGAEIALKIGRADNDSPSTLHHEYDMYTALAGCAGISPVRWYGKEGTHEVIVLEHLRTSLSDLVSEQQVDRSKTFLYASQMLSTVELLHTQHYIHRDIKPGNFIVRANNPHPTVFLVDFSLVQLFRNPVTCLHIPYSTDESIVGTLPFTSRNGQQGHAQSRRDNLESLIYTIIYSACGDLPWMTISSREAVLQTKMLIMTEELCQGLPTPFCEFIDYVYSLDFKAKPDYQYLHSILSQCSAATDHPGKALPSPLRSPVHVDRTPVFGGRV